MCGEPRGHCSGAFDKAKLAHQKCNWNTIGMEKARLEFAERSNTLVYRETVMQKQLKFQIAACLLATGLVTATPAFGEQVYMEHERYGAWEISLHYVHLASQRISDVTAADLDAASTSAWGTTVGYNFNNQLSLGLEMTVASPDYRPVLNGEGADAPRNYEMDLSSTLLKGTWHMRPDGLTPYVSLGVGWTYLDSNIVSGEGHTDCWWDPWWGYTCANYYPTEDDTKTTLSAAAGVRWDFHNQFFTRISYGKMWLGDASSPAVTRLEIGWRR